MKRSVVKHVAFGVAVAIYVSIGFHLIRRHMGSADSPGAANRIAEGAIAFGLCTGLVAVLAAIARRRTGHLALAWSGALASAHIAFLLIASNPEPDQATSAFASGPLPIAVLVVALSTFTPALARMTVAATSAFDKVMSANTR